MPDHDPVTTNDAPHRAQGRARRLIETPEWTTDTGRQDLEGDYSAELLRGVLRLSWVNPFKTVSRQVELERLSQDTRRRVKTGCPWIDPRNWSDDPAIGAALAELEQEVAQVKRQYARSTKTAPRLKTIELGNLDPTTVIKTINHLDFVQTSDGAADDISDATTAMAQVAGLNRWPVVRVVSAYGTAFLVTGPAKELDKVMRQLHRLDTQAELSEARRLTEAPMYGDWRTDEVGVRNPVEFGDDYSVDFNDGKAFLLSYGETGPHRRTSVRWRQRLASVDVSDHPLVKATKPGVKGGRHEDLANQLMADDEVRRKMHAAEAEVARRLGGPTKLIPAGDIRRLEVQVPASIYNHVADLKTMEWNFNGYARHGVLIDMMTHAEPGEVLRFLRVQPDTGLAVVATPEAIDRAVRAAHRESAMDKLDA